MRKVRTALDTAIRTKNVRSFSGRSGRLGRNREVRPDTGMAVRSVTGNGRQRRALAIQYRREGLAKLSPAQKRAFERLSINQQEELLIKTEKKIDRRISLGRYRESGTPAAVAVRTAGIQKGRVRSQESRAKKYSEQMEQSEWSKDSTELQPVDSSVERQLQETRAGEVYSIAAGYRRKRNARQQARKKKEQRLQERRNSETSIARAFSKDIQEGLPGTTNGTKEKEINPLRWEQDTGSAGEAQKTREKAGRRIGRDYAKVLGRAIESQVRFTRQLENSRSFYQKQNTIQEMEEKEARRISGIVSFSLSKAKAVAGDLVKAVKLLASRGRGFLILLLVPVMLLVMMVPLLLSSVALTEEEATAGATATELVEYALSWVGVTQYVWGAGRAYETDWQDYTDCSGFVHGVFSHFGFEIGGTTVYMEDNGTLVDTNSTAKALPGDIILFFTGGIAPGNSTHVGIYIGDGQMVHCTGSRSNVSPETAGPGVMVTMVSYSSREYQVRRIIPESASGGVGTGGHRVDPTKYSTSDLQLIWAIVAQEDNGSYEGALAVISSAMNRTESPTWSYLGNTAMKQLCAPGQYCYSNDNYWVPRLGGNVPEYVKQAVNDCLKKGIRNHSFTSFRSTKGKTTGPNAVQIGGNWFFGN